ncbi:MAG: pseudouridylate synthase [Chloroflexota bacterium]|nr:pseudouridylate synthase [Chloroflexota bacterium]
MVKINYQKAVKQALDQNGPVVALESTVITHGLPYPQNRDTALGMEAEVSAAGAVPATICLTNGEIQVGLEAEQMEYISTAKDPVKVSRRDIAAAIVSKRDGGTTVSGTMEIAYKAGLRVFATGGIGGVHRGNLMDVSADLPTLAQIPMIVVCSGAKAILDLPATREVLETYGIPVIGYQTDDLPAFYSSSSGLPVDHNAQTAAEIAQIAMTQWEFGLKATILVTVPPPAELAIPSEEIEGVILEAVKDAEEQGIKGSKITPFLLAKVSEKSHERSLTTNVALLKNNAHVAGLIAGELSKISGK